MKHLGTKTIETERLILRRFTPEDADAMYRNWAGDPEVTKYMTWPTHRSVEDTKTVLADWIAAYDRPEKYEWCITRKETGEPIGSMGVAGCNEKAESMEVGYCIGRAYWNRGITSEAFAAVIRYLTGEVGAKRIEAKHDVKNPASGRVMEKCGLKYEGTRIRADWNNSGVCDCAMYGMVVSGADGDTQADVRQQKDKAAPQEVTEKRKNRISDETIEYVGILAKLELSEEEKERAKKDMEEMLDYIDKLEELDTEGVEPMSHVFPINNVFREDVVTNGDGSAAALANAPEKKDGGFKVPKTIG